jgi:D-alanyl-D-alanine carboxypeptidase
MLRKQWASSHLMRVGVFGLFTIATAAVLTTDSAEARRYHRHSHSTHARSHHHSDDGDYSPQFSSIIVDANSGATLTSTSPDGLRHPASLTKIMTLYLLFERLEAGKMTLDTEMPVSEHASEQAPTKLGLRPGQTIRVEDAIKGIVTRSANDAAVVIAEAIGGDEDTFARMMTRKARALGMSRTTYHNASGLPNDEQITTARDEATLGRAIQDRFPRYYRYFSTISFNYRGQQIRNHNHLLGEVEGVDGIKTGYTRASGFNLVTSIRRGNRHLIGVVMGGRSSGSRDAIMRNLLAANLDKASTTRTAAAITERNSSDIDVADGNAPSRSMAQAPAAQDQSAPPARTTAASKIAAAISQATAAVPPRTEPAPLTSGVIQSPSMTPIPGSSEPMKPVRVKTVQVKAGPLKLAAAGPSQPVAPVEGAAPPRVDVPETSSGILGVLPASSLPPSSTTSSTSSQQMMAYASPQPQPRETSQPAQQAAAAKPAVVRTGWIVQVGALDSENEAQQRIETARSRAKGLLSKADPFTETVVAKDNKMLYRARFAGLDRDQAEAVCRTLKRSDISCMTVHN